jgi:photosystem II stability/assembly factor-like uncharacterized protein
MKRTRILRTVLVTAILLAVAAMAAPITGQEIVFTETFDDASLPEWEHPPDVTVADGVLRIEPNGFAFHAGFWANFSLSVRARHTGEGHLVIYYRWSEDANYALRLAGEFVAFERQLLGPPAELGVAPASILPGEWVEITVMVTDGTHQVALNGSTLLTATDPDPLPEGGIGFRVEGTAAGEFDDLVLTGEGEAPPPLEPTPISEPSPPVEAPTTPAAITEAELTWVRTGGPPGGLGYDIRYNFDDPNIWYVTDNFAGVHVSTDNGLTWQPSNTGIPPQLGPTGDWIPIFCLTVDPHNPQIIWAGTDRTGHIYKSTDGARTWQQRDNGVTIEYDGLTFRGFTVDPRSSDIVYAMGETSNESLGGPSVWGSGTGGVVYKTINGGESWERIWGEPPPSSLARYMWIDPRDPDVLYVSTGIFDRGAVGEGDPSTDPFGGLGILKSTDGGQTWRIFNEDNGLRMLYLGSLFMHPDNPDVLLAAAGHTLEGPAGEYVGGLVAGGETAPSGVYRTSDGGEHWTQVLVSAPQLAGEAFAAVELCPSDPNTAYAGSELAVYRSEDAGQSWRLVSGGVKGWGPPGVMAGWPIDMQCDPRDPNRVFANNYNGGNFLSEDGGRTWENASQGYTGAQTRSIAVDPYDASRVYVAGRSGIWRTDDGGTSWYGLYYPPAEPATFGLEWQAVAADPSRRDHVLVGAIVRTVIMESEDGGASWQVRWSVEQISDELPPGIAKQVPSTIVFAPSEPTTVYASMASDGCVMMHEAVCEAPGAGVIVSHDGGTSWKRAVDDHLRDMGVLDLAVDPAEARTVYAAAAAGLYKTTDGGLTWTPLTGLPKALPVRAVAVSPNDSQRILVGLEGMGVYVTADGGQSWHAGVAGLEANNSLHDIVFDPISPQIVYASDFLSGVYRSTDGGLTWTKTNDGLRVRSAMVLTISEDGQHLYVATNGEGVFRLDLSGQPPQPGAQASPTVQVGPVLPVGTPSEVQPTTAPLPCGLPGICPGAAALPLAVLSLVLVSYRRR